MVQSGLTSVQATNDKAMQPSQTISERFRQRRKRLSGINIFFVFIRNKARCAADAKAAALLEMMMMMMMMTIYRARIYPRCNSMLITLERPQSSS